MDTLDLETNSPDDALTGLRTRIDLHTEQLTRHARELSRLGAELDQLVY
ncbi:hypothetical protein [Kibdelosporangium persicum]|nr:hypothetical protein [Kibdelosporangium persicum]